MSPPKRVLLVGFHFPPLTGSSGIQRTLRFAQHLPTLGWEALVLTAHPWAYERTSPDLNADVPVGTVVRRAFALDVARHLAIKGRYVDAMARPDRWVSWRFDGVRQGMQMIREFSPQVIWSTYPIATAHLIGAELQRRSGLPWIADFRDPMAQDGYPPDLKTWKSYKLIEEHALARAALSVFTTPSAADQYRHCYPTAAARIRLLENGFDEESFAHIDLSETDGPLAPGAVTLLHSGVVYPSERDPTQLMAALRRLHDAGTIRPGRFRVRFRAPVADALVARLAAENGVSEYVEILPAVPYKTALSEMLRADGLLVMQASNCNAQIPAKLYEYMRAGRPLLCLCDPAGDTAHVLREAGVGAMARLDNPDEIFELLTRFLDGPSRTETLPQVAYVQKASRLSRTQVLAGWLDELCASH
jgi:glycosyltransferase involved in cell wall biosynthesis